MLRRNIGPRAIGRIAHVGDLEPTRAKSPLWGTTNRNQTGTEVSPGGSTPKIAIYTTRHHQNPLKTNVQRQSHSRIPFATVLYSHRVVNVFHAQPFGAAPDSQPVHCTTESLCPE